MFLLSAELRFITNILLEFCYFDISNMQNIHTNCVNYDREEKRLSTGLITNLFNILLLSNTKCKKNVMYIHFLDLWKINSYNTAHLQGKKTKNKKLLTKLHWTQQLLIILRFSEIIKTRIILFNKLYRKRISRI